MRFTKRLAGWALAAGLMLSGTTALKAEEWRDGRGDYRAIEVLRARVAQDQWRLNEDYSRGRRWAVDRDRRQLERDRRALESRERDLRHDRHDGDRNRWR
jgi:hypothetical protein